MYYDDNPVWRGAPRHLGIVASFVVRSQYFPFRIVYAMRGTAAHLKHGCGIAGDAVGDKCL